MDDCPGARDIPLLYAHQLLYQDEGGEYNLPYSVVWQHYLPWQTPDCDLRLQTLPPDIWNIDTQPTRRASDCQQLSPHAQYP